MTNEAKTQTLKIALELANGAVAESAPITCYENDADGTTVAELVKSVREFTTGPTFRMVVGDGAPVFFNPQHIVTAQIVRVG